MTIYLLLYSSFAYFYILFNKVYSCVSKKGVRSYIYGLFIFLILALRHPTMGYDLNYGGSTGYLPNFHTFASFSFSELFYYLPLIRYENGYVIFNWVVSQLFGDYDQVLLLWSAFFSIAPIAHLFYKESTSIELSYIIYLSLQSFLICFSGLRQGIAVGLCMIAFSFIQQHSWKKFICMVLLASSFHASSILFLIAYPLYYLKIPPQNRWITVVCLIVVYFFRTPIFMVLSKILKDDAVINESGAVTFFIVYVAVYIFCFLFAENNERNNGLLNITLVACFCFAFTGIYSIAMRAAYCFMNFLPLVLPIAIKNIQEKNLKLAIQIFVIMSFLTFGLESLYSTYWSKSFPYIFFWE